jgi:fructan beta-fructosidase
MVRSLVAAFLFAVAMLAASCSLQEAQTPAEEKPLEENPSEESQLFDERHRPQYHFTPRQNWMNDPNGLVYYDGQYHLFFQHNPYGNTWGNMSWGHATSTDLVHWKHQPIAIREEGNEMIFSGSAVVDEKNTSGFGEEGGKAPMVAIYTSHYEEGEGFNQAQSLAYSTDSGETWTKYEGNPVLDHETPDFRDPKVFRYKDKWVMVVALSTEHKVQLYESQNLKEWSLMSEFGPAGATGGVWECPDLFELPVDGNPEDTRWVLEVDINPGAFSGGSGAQYFVGDFDGTTFTEDESVRDEGEALWVDYGKDFYAAITWNNVPSGRRLWVGWMNNWSYANEIPTSPWRSAQSVPRKLKLRTIDGDPRLVQEPAEELEQLRQRHQRVEGLTVGSGEQSLSGEGISGKALELEATLSVSEANRAGFKVRGGESQETVIGYDTESGEVYVDRTDAGKEDFSAAFPARMTAPLRVEDGEVTLRVLVDWSSVEVFAQNGARILTSRIFPDSESQDVRFFARGGEAELVAMDAWEIASVWNGEE